MSASRKPIMKLGLLPVSASSRRFLPALPLRFMDGTVAPGIPVPESGVDDAPKSVEMSGHAPRAHNGPRKFPSRISHDLRASGGDFRGSLDAADRSLGLRLCRIEQNMTGSACGGILVLSTTQLRPFAHWSGCPNRSMVLGRLFNIGEAFRALP